MSYELRPVTPADAAGVVRANMTAFYGNASYRLLWPNMTLEEIIAGTEKRFPRGLVQGRDKMRHQMVVETTTGEIVGYARWMLPKDGSITWLEAQVAEPSVEDQERFEASWKSTCEDGRPKGLNQERLNFLNPPLGAEDKVIRGDREYLEVDFISALPSHQKRGVGEMLLCSGIAKADTAGVPVIVMATPAGLRLYEKNGFKRISTVELDDSKFDGTGSHISHFLIREPVKA